MPPSGPGTRPPPAISRSLVRSSGTGPGWRHAPRTRTVPAETSRARSGRPESGQRAARNSRRPPHRLRLRHHVDGASFGPPAVRLGHAPASRIWPPVTFPPTHPLPPQAREALDDPPGGRLRFHPAQRLDGPREDPPGRAGYRLAVGACILQNHFLLWRRLLLGGRPLLGGRLRPRRLPLPGTPALPWTRPSLWTPTRLGECAPRDVRPPTAPAVQLVPPRARSLSRGSATLRAAAAAASSASLIRVSRDVRVLHRNRTPGRRTQRLGRATVDTARSGR